MPEVTMPRLTDSMQEGAISRWIKAEGDEVRRGEELVEIETDKAVMAYEADFAGALRIIVAEGRTVPVGTVIATIGEPAASHPAGTGGNREAVTTTALEPGSPAAGSVNGTATVGARASKPGVSPMARRFAVRLGVDLASVSGSGPRGRILKRDVVAAADRAEAAAASAGATRADSTTVSAPANHLAARGADDRLEPLSRIQQIIARQMTESRQTVPDFALDVDVDMSGCLHMRAELKLHADPAPSLNDIIVKACGIALRRHPRANGSYRSNGVALHPRVNVAVAIASEAALVAPVVSDVDVKSLGAIAADTRRLIQAVRAARVAPADLEGGTFTVSNLGMYGIDRFEGIINAPQAAILCVGAVTDRPVVKDGAVIARPMASMTLACDHRILNGADAAQFLQELRSLLEHPLALTL